MPVHWHGPATIIATVYLNLPFWELHGTDVWMMYKPWSYAGV